MKRTWLLQMPRCLALIVWTSIVTPSSAAEPKIDPLDWPYWRGPEYNSISRETGLPDSINPDGGAGSNLAWAQLTTAVPTGNSGAQHPVGPDALAGGPGDAP